MKHFPDSHTGMNIKLKIDSMLDRLGLANSEIPLFAVNDSAANAKKAIQLSEHLIQILCAIHKLQLCIEDVMKTRLLFAGVASIVDLLTKTKGLAQYVKRSGPALNALKAACKEEKVKFKTLKNPNETRWNSKHANLKSVLHVKKALVKLAEQDETNDWSSRMLSPAEWKLAEGVVKVLELPLHVTKVWEAEVRPTMNLVISELFTMTEKLKQIDNNMKNCRFTRDFARMLRGKVLQSEPIKRFPMCGAEEEIYRYGNYLDPVFKGVHLEALEALQKTKQEMVERWDEADDEEEGKEEDEDEDPTTKLLNARKKLAEKQKNSSKLRREMVTYEDMECLAPDGDRLEWWRHHKDLLPLLAKAAQEILAIPCSSSKSERIFSIGGQVSMQYRTDFTGFFIRFSTLRTCELLCYLSSPELDIKLSQ